MTNISELVPVYAAAMILAVCSHIRSGYSVSLVRYRYRENFCYICMAVILILFAGLRTRYNDTGTYMEMYEVFPVDGRIADSVSNWSIGANPGFNLVNILLRMGGISTQSFLMFFSAVTLGVYFWFFKKYSINIWLTVFLFLFFAGYIFTLAAIKQCAAVAFCLIAVDCALRKKWIPFTLWVLLAVTFHPYSIMYLAVPYLMCRPWSGRTYLTMLVFGLVGILLESMLGTIVDITSMFGEGYDIESFNGEGVNPFRLAVVAVPLLLSFMARHHIAQMDPEREKSYFLFVNLAILNAEIMFVALFGTANYFARLANYFVVFQALSLPWLLQFFEKKSRQMLTTFAVVGYSLFFYYENAINRSFNADYDHIPLVEYLQSIF